MKTLHFLVTYKRPDTTPFRSREYEIIEAQSEYQAQVNAWQKAKTSKWEVWSVKELAPDQVELEKKRLKDRRKTRYQDSINRY